MAAAAAAVIFIVLVLAGAARAGPMNRAAAYLESRQQNGGGFAEPGGTADPSLTGWVVLGLRAAGRTPAGAAAYLSEKPDLAATDLALRILALAALGQDVDDLVRRLEELRLGDGRIGPAVNSTAWGILALRAAGRPPGAISIEYLLAAQGRNGGWSWAAGGAPDSNDTAAVLQALRAGGVPSASKAIRRGLGYLRRLQNSDGGFELTTGRGSDAPSTAWAIQAFLAAGRSPDKDAFDYLARLRQADGSYRYSVEHVSSPVWTTAQVLAALARKPFPLRTPSAFPLLVLAPA